MVSKRRNRKVSNKRKSSKRANTKKRQYRSYRKYGGKKRDFFDDALKQAKNTDSSVSEDENKEKSFSLSTPYTQYTQSANSKIQPNSLMGVKRISPTLPGSNYNNNLLPQNFKLGQSPSPKLTFSQKLGNIFKRNK